MLERLRQTDIENGASRERSNGANHIYTVYIALPIKVPSNIRLRTAVAAATAYYMRTPA